MKPFLKTLIWELFLIISVIFSLIGELLLYINVINFISYAEKVPLISAVVTLSISIVSVGFAFTNMFFKNRKEKYQRIITDCTLVFSVIVLAKSIQYVYLI